METTLNVLINIIKQNKITINELSLSSGVNKGTLSSIVKGSRKLSESVLKRVLNADIFDENDKEELIDSFISDEYGRNTLQKIKHFLTSLKEQSEFETKEFVPLIPDLKGFNTEGEYEFLSGKNEIFKGITALMFRSLKARQNIYTNYSFDNPELDEIIYGILLGSENRSNLFHIVTFTEDKKSSKNIDIAFALVKYMQIGVNAYYRIDKNNVSDFADELYSYYFVTDDTVVFYDREFSSGVYVRKTDFVHSIYSKLKTQFKNYHLLCRFPDNVLSQMDDLATVTDSEVAIRFYPFVLNCFTKDDWDSCISDVLENKETLIEVAFSWYGSERSHGTISHSTTDGWLYFLKNGTIPELPDCLVPDIDIECRRKIVERVIENFKAGVASCRIIDPRIKLPQKLMVEQIGEYIFFITTVNNKPELQWLGSAFLLLPVKKDTGDIKALLKYLEIKGYIYSSEESVTVLENMLSHYRNEMSIKNIIL